MGKWSLSYTFKVSHLGVELSVDWKRLDLLLLICRLFLVLKHVGEPVFNKIKCWLLSRFSNLSSSVSFGRSPESVMAVKVSRQDQWSWKLSC